MIIKNVNDVINDVFEVTGFSDILTIEYNKNMALWNSFAKPYFYYKE